MSSAAQDPVHHLEQLVDLGLPEEVGIDPLGDRLRAEVVGENGVQLLPAIAGAWARS